MDRQMTGGWVPKLTKILINEPCQKIDEKLSSIADLLIDNQIVRNPKNKRVTTVETLMSGLRQTTLMGLAFNVVKTQVSVNIIRLVASKLNDREQAYAYLIVKNAIGGRGAPHKQAVLLNKAEFLRERLTVRSIEAYSARVVPGLSQRKPWNSDPLDPLETLRTLVDTFMTITRRAKIKMSPVPAVQAFCAAYKVDPRVMGLSREAGGLGVGPLVQGKIVRPPANQVDVRVEIKNPWRLRRYDTILSKYGIVSSQPLLWVLQDVQNILINNRSSETFARLRPALKKHFLAKIIITGRASIVNSTYSSMVYDTMVLARYHIRQFAMSHLLEEDIQLALFDVSSRKRGDFLVLRREGQSVNEAFKRIGYGNEWYRVKNWFPYIVAENYMFGEISTGRFFGESKYLSPLIRLSLKIFIKRWRSLDSKIRTLFKVFDVLRYDYLQLVVSELHSVGLWTSYSA
jgi:hypothetical protein